MQSICACCDDHLFDFYKNDQSLNAFDLAVLKAIERRSMITGRMSFQEVARDAHVSVRKVGEIVRRLAGRLITYVHGVGMSGILRVNLPRRHGVPGSTDEPRHGVPTPNPPTLPALPEEDLKALRIKRSLKETGEVKACASTPPAADLKFSEEEKKQVQEVVGYYYQLRGVKQIDPRLGADLYLRILCEVRSRGTDVLNMAVLAHFHETRQAKFSKFDTLENCFACVRVEGKKNPREIDESWLQDRIDRGYRIQAEEAKKRAQDEEHRERMRLLEHKVDPEQAARRCRELMASLG